MKNLKKAESLKSILKTESKENGEPLLTIPRTILKALRRKDSRLGYQMTDMLAYFIEKEDYFKNEYELEDNWFYLLQNQIETDLAFNKVSGQIRKTIHALETLKLLRIKRKGKRNFYKLNYDNIIKLKYQSSSTPIKQSSSTAIKSKYQSSSTDLLYNKEVLIINNNNDKRFEKKTPIDSDTLLEKKKSFPKIDYSGDRSKRKVIAELKKDVLVEYLIKVSNNPEMPQTRGDPNSKVYHNISKFFKSLKSGSIGKDYIFDPLWQKHNFITEKDLNHNFSDDEIKSLCDKLPVLYQEGSRAKNKSKLPQKNLYELLYRVSNFRNKNYKHTYENGGYSYFLSNWKKSPSPTEKARMEQIDNEIKYSKANPKMTDEEIDADYERREQEWLEQGKKEKQERKKGKTKIKSDSWHSSPNVDKLRVQRRLKEREEDEERKEFVN